MIAARLLQKSSQPKMDADQAIKSAKEGWAFPSEDILCRSCLMPVAVYGWDLNGDPIFDAMCPACIAKAILLPLAETMQYVPPRPRQDCNRGCGSPPIHGMAWCGPCAVSYQETFRGKEPDALIDARIKQFRDRMKSSGPG